MTVSTAGRFLRAGVVAALVVAAATACADQPAGPDQGTGHHGGKATTSATPEPGSTASGSARGGHNEFDVTFVNDMVVHHQQALAMARLAPGRAGQQVAELAEQIAKAQGPEIATMSGWLRSWGEPVPSPGNDPHAGHGSAMPGMMTPEQMQELEASKGAAFDKRFLTMMIEHHEGAVQMADHELRAGSYEPAKELARAVRTTQTAEIVTMRQMLGG